MYSFWTYIQILLILIHLFYLCSLCAGLIYLIYKMGVLVFHLPQYGLWEDSKETYNKCFKNCKSPKNRVILNKIVYLYFFPYLIHLTNLLRFFKVY